MEDNRAEDDHEPQAEYITCECHSDFAKHEGFKSEKLSELLDEDMIFCSEKCMKIEEGVYQHELRNVDDYLLVEFKEWLSDDGTEVIRGILDSDPKTKGVIKSLMNAAFFAGQVRGR